MKAKAATLLALLLTILTALTACTPTSVAEADPLKHATLLRMTEREGVTLVEIADPWHEGKVLRRYLLVPEGVTPPADLPEGTVVHTPLHRIVATSAVHAALAADLGAENAVAGVCDVPFIIRHDLRRAVAEGRIADAGSSMQPDRERIIALRPDAILVSPFENAGYGALEALGVPLIECADYMEDTPTGRAEWMRLYAALLGRRERGDSLFATVIAAYDSLRRTAATATEHPRLVCDTKEGGGWMMPGGRSYLGTLYADAGADYVLADRPERGTVTLGPEEALCRGREADVWLVKTGSEAPLTREGLAADNPAVRQFRAWQRGRVYGCNTLRVPYYEEVPFHPDRLLRDIIHLVHPALLPDHRPRYWTPLP